MDGVNRPYPYGLGSVDEPSVVVLVVCALALCIHRATTAIATVRRLNFPIILIFFSPYTISIANSLLKNDCNSGRSESRELRFMNFR